jgi:hypothetical protein
LTIEYIHSGARPEKRNAEDHQSCSDNYERYSDWGLQQDLTDCGFHNIAFTFFSQGLRVVLLA